VTPEQAKSFSDYLRAGNALVAAGRPGNAIADFQRAVDIDNNSPVAWESLGNALQLNGRFGQAVVAFSLAAKLSPANCATRLNLASALAECAEIAAAIDQIKLAHSLDPTNSRLASASLYLLWFCGDLTEQQIIAEHRAWADKFAEPLKASWKPHANSREPNRRLKIGYLSPDLRLHPVGRFMLPIFVEHNHAEFEIHAYSANRNPPDVTSRRIQQRCDGWHDIAWLSDDAAAEMIRNDGIDILIDLSLHMGRRMGIFARKPAPVQITYLAYVGTTGLDAIDWRITDPVLEPVPANFVEKPLVIPHYWCFKPSVYEYEPGPAPHQRLGHTMFGSLNSFKKTNVITRALWASALRAVPNSRMLVHAPEGSCRENFLNDMTALGVEQSRITFIGLLPISQYMQTWQNIDIALDTFPYTGGTTTCDALWMGVPTITLAGDLGISRMSASILTTVGVPELIARDAAEFTCIAATLAQNPDRMSELRATMRPRLAQSPLTDAKRFTQDLQDAFRRAWREWCQKPR
jgi:protein O-GlcNAc transferase